METGTVGLAGLTRFTIMSSNESTNETPSRPDEFIVGYDPKYKTAVEIWSVDGTLIAEMPWGERHIGREANEVLKESVLSDRILVHEVRRGSTDG